MKQPKKTKTFTVRLIKPSNKPTLPKVTSILKTSPRTLQDKALSILAGSGMGVVAGISIYATLMLLGIDLGNLESSVIIGLPSLLGLFASYVVL